MYKADYKRIALTGILALGILLAGSGILDSVSQEYTDSAMQRSLIAFGVARGLNGIISVVQGTEIAVHPAGFGINFTPGQVLDPVNDLVEQFSWIMLLSSTSLGIQKLFLNIGSTLTATMFLSVCLVALLFVIWRPDNVGPYARRIIVLVSLFVIFLRFSVPIATVLGQGIYQGFLSTDYQIATEGLQRSRESISQINSELEHEDSTEQTLFEKAKRYLESTSDALDYEKKIDKYQELAGDISKNAVKLVIVFIAQSVILPILFLWIIALGLRTLARQIMLSPFSH